MVSVEIYAEVVELRKLPKGLIEMALSIKRPVEGEEPTKELREIEDLLPRPVMEFVKRTMERVSEIRVPDIVIRLSPPDYERLGRPVIGDKIRLLMEKLL